ncbi:hypothetical protein [Mucilaginibacter myungsuensis]|uniref:Uncharacterized protein n=1 Tax=Mucilaginibacter myungsuensis TaxID=649104 RepID=A0A929L4D0_9SPHI|nr:hypothetical protein [Mucilaginibacter myungsuensis]MBE9663795.1 hypothetical protein [Mucilaginibacter myungsuensis]MDN3598489.1 hypothetical protein [Mucilaginibacter myungsuensis]
MDLITCKNCGQAGTGKFCHSCGEPHYQHRITLGHMLHEAAHLITHFDKGFL